MKQLLALILLAGCSWVNSQSLGLLLTGFQLFNADNTETYYAKVQARGPDFETAKTRAFRLAVEEAAGTVVLSETELRDQNIRRDEIVTYSSGFVDRYTVLSRQDLGNSVEIVIEVWVAHSSIANRLLAKNSSSQGIDGQKLATQTESILDERVRGDRLLRTVLADHPRRSMAVKLSQPKITMDVYRNVVVTVDWELHWADQFRTSLTEVVKQFKTNSSCWSNCPPRFGLLGYTIEDAQKAVLVYQHLAHTPIAIQFQTIDQAERVINVRCLPVDLEGVMVTMYNDTVSMPNKWYSNKQLFNFGTLPQNITNLHRFQAQVVERTQCLR
jgi:hypothetical protein